MSRPKLEDRPSSLNRGDRPHRVPINGYRDVLQVTGQEPGFHYCWVNEDKVPRYESGGYEAVTHDVQVGDKKVNMATQIGGKVSLAVGNQVTAILMRIPQEYYDEDMAEFNKELDAKDAAMRDHLNSKDDGRYGSVSIARGRG